MRKLLLALCAALFSTMTLAQGGVSSDGAAVTASGSAVTYSGRDSGLPNTD